MAKRSEIGTLERVLLGSRGLLLASEPPGLSSRVCRAAARLEPCPEEPLVARCAAAKTAILTMLQSTTGSAACML